MSALVALLAPFVLPALRVLPLVAMLPFLGGRALPAPAKLAVALSLAAALGPFARSEVPAQHGRVLLAAAGELSLGVVLALVVGAPFLALSYAGRTLDTLRGAPSDAQEGAPSGSALATLQRGAGVAVFLGAGGHHGVLRALAASFEALPAGRAPLDLWRSGRLTEACARWTAESLSAALWIGSSGLLALVGAELALALASRFSPPLARSGLALPVRALTPLAALALGVGLWTGATMELASRALLAAKALVAPG